MRINNLPLLSGQTQTSSQNQPTSAKTTRDKFKNQSRSGKNNSVFCNGRMHENSCMTNNLSGDLATIDKTTNEETKNAKKDMKHELQNKEVIAKDIQKLYTEESLESLFDQFHDLKINEESDKILDLLKSICHQHLSSVGLINDNSEASNELVEKGLDKKKKEHVKPYSKPNYVTDDGSCIDENVLNSMSEEEWKFIKQGLVNIMGLLPNSGDEQPQSYVQCPSNVYGFNVPIEDQNNATNSAVGISEIEVMNGPPAFTNTYSDQLSQEFLLDQVDGVLSTFPQSVGESSTSDYVGSPVGLGLSPNPSVTSDVDFDQVIGLKSPVASSVVYPTTFDGLVCNKRNLSIATNNVPSSPLTNVGCKITHPHLQSVGYVIENQPSRAQNRPNIIVVEPRQGVVYPKYCSKTTTDANISQNLSSGRNYRPIERVRGPEVYEMEMQKSGYERLLESCKCKKKKNSLIIQWVMTLIKTDHLDAQQKPLLLINLLMQLVKVFQGANCSAELVQLKQVWREKLIAHIECVNQLLKQPHIFRMPDMRNNTPLKIAALSIYNEPLIARCIADCIVKAGDNPDEIDIDGNSMLHLLCQKGDTHVVVLAELLNVKSKLGLPAFNVNLLNKEMKTPLHLAVEFRSLSSVKILIAHQARVDLKDYHNSTPLHAAVRGEYDIHILRSILESPSCQEAFNIEDNEGSTPLTIALKNTLVHKKTQCDALELILIGGANRKQRPVDRAVLAHIDQCRREDIEKVLQRKKKPSYQQLQTGFLLRST